jgi:hypothetical protein
VAVQHHHHDEPAYERTATVVSGDRSGPAAALIAVLALLLVAFLIWFFAFSGVVFDRHAGTSGTTGTRIEQNTNNNTNSGVPSGNASMSTVPTPAST